LDWYAQARRAMPWRQTRDPYAIWVSEIMLQQTQVNTVTPYYLRFMERFPTACHLANAPLDELLALWQGLGYYSRARNLHRAARLVCERHGGQLPSDPATLRALPGIGDYAAGAILSIAFGQDVVAVDGNVIRVLCRLYDEEHDPKASPAKQRLRQRAEDLLPAGQAGDWNQAVMELGATLCTPSGPRCAECPLRPFCLAHARGTVAVRPVRIKRQPTPVRENVAALICQEGRVLVVRRKPEGLLGGLWELPNGEVGEGLKPTEVLADLLRSQLALRGQPGAELAVIRHAYTHFRVVVHVHPFQALGEPMAGGPWDAAHWLGADERDRFGLTGVTHKILARVPWPGSGLLL
jgi:A/G-specific adenine glycosylase